MAVLLAMKIIWATNMHIYAKISQLGLQQSRVNWIQTKRDLLAALDFV